MRDFPDTALVPVWSFLQDAIAKELLKNSIPTIENTGNSPVCLLVFEKGWVTDERAELPRACMPSTGAQY